MSMQADSSIPISLAPGQEQQHIRLLELPSELLSLLTADDPPALYLKSGHVGGDIAKDANVVLCTPTTTYQVRQVSTSNSVYVTTPCNLSANDAPGAPQTGVEAVCKCDSMIELLPAAAVSAVASIRAALPVFLSTGSYSSQQSVSRAELYSNIPLSQAECEQGWNELACFESADPAGCFIPSAKVRSEAWQAVLTTATAAGIDLTISYPSIGLPHFLADLEADWPADLLAAILRSVSQRDADGDLAVSEEKCVRFVGLSLLEARSEGHAVPTAPMLQAWQDAVPERWRERCQLPVLSGYYTLANSGNSIAYTAESTANNSANSSVAPNAKSSVGAKRKWHEKFRPTKKS